MYGLLLKNLQDFVVEKYGAKKWESVKEALKLTEVSWKKMLLSEAGHICICTYSCCCCCCAGDGEFLTFSPHKGESFPQVPPRKNVLFIYVYAKFTACSNILLPYLPSENVNKGKDSRAL